MLAFSFADMFVAQQAKAIPPVKEKKYISSNQAMGKFESVLNGKVKKKKLSLKRKKNISIGTKSE